MLFAYLYKYLCWAVSIPWRLATISNMNPKDELREGFIVQTGNRSKNHLNKPIIYQLIRKLIRSIVIQLLHSIITYRIDPVPESTLKNIRAVSPMISNTNRALWLRSLSVAWMTKGLPSSARTTLLIGAASLTTPIYLLGEKGNADVSQIFLRSVEKITF